MKGSDAVKNYTNTKKVNGEKIIFEHFKIREIVNLFLILIIKMGKINDMWSILVNLIISGSYTGAHKIIPIYHSLWAV